MPPAGARGDAIYTVCGNISSVSTPTAAGDYDRHLRHTVRHREQNIVCHQAALEGHRWPPARFVASQCCRYGTRFRGIWDRANIIITRLVGFRGVWTTVSCHGGSACQGEWCRVDYLPMVTALDRHNVVL